MKRLTRRYVDGQAYVSIYSVAAMGESECVGPAITRLAAFEDILGDEYELVDLRELVQAKREDRLHITPKTAWHIGETKGIHEVPYSPFVEKNLGKKFWLTREEAVKALCETLGVEVDEEWRATGNDIATYKIKADGSLMYRMPKYDGLPSGKWYYSDSQHLTEFIGHPERIVHNAEGGEEG